MDAKDANRFNQILFLDSLPVSEFNMAKRLFEDIETYANAYKPSPSVKYVRVESGNALVECLSEARRRAATEGALPMLHIECHGNEDGFELADGSFADWAELKQPITDLNVATRLNLVIAVAACTGGALIKAVRMSDMSLCFMRLSKVSIAMLLSGLRLWENRYSLSGSWTFARSIMAMARGTSGTLWGRPAFMRSAGTSQRASVTSLRFAPVTSAVRAAVKIANSRASAAMASRPCRFSMNAGTSANGSAWW